MVTFDGAWWNTVPDGDRLTLLNEWDRPGPSQSAITILARLGVPVEIDGSASAVAIPWPNGLQAFLAQEHLRRNPPQGVAGNLPRNLSNRPSGE